MKIKEGLVGGYVSLGRERTLENVTMRPEVKVDIASGVVTEIKSSGNDNYQVHLTITGADYPMSGFINGDDPVLKVFQKAHEAGEVVIVRFEKKRKSKVALDATIEDLTKDMVTAKENIVKITSGVYSPNKGQWLLTSEAESTPSEDPDWVMRKIESLVYDSEMIDGFFDTQAPAQVNFSGDYVNNKANQLITMYHFIKESEIKYEYELTDEQRKKLSSMLLAAVDNLQIAVYGLNEPNYKDYSHTRARYMLFKYEEQNPLNLDAVKAIGEWANTFLRESVELWRWSIETATPAVASEH